MSNSRTLSLFCIKPNLAQLVKQALSRQKWAAFLFILILFSAFFHATHSWAEDKETDSKENDTQLAPPPPDDSPPSGDSSPPPLDPDEDTKEEKAAILPEIEARTFPVRVIRRSASNRVYLLEDVKNRQPTVGTILLFKREGVALMAFRILKLYPEKQFFAAKRVRKYQKFAVLEDSEAFLAVEKVADITPPPPDAPPPSDTPPPNANAHAPTVQDQKDLKELEKAEGLIPKHFDPELDAGTSPSPKSNEEENEDDSQTLHDVMSIEESKVIDRHNHWLTAGFGFFSNGAPPNAATGISSGTYLFSSGNLRYGYTIARSILAKKPNLQDSLALEGGFYLYKCLSYAITTDSYSVLNPVISLRYTVMTSESFGFFFYSGISKGLVLSGTLTQPNAISDLSETMPLLGTGLLLQIGPSWYTRLDLGIDAVGLALLLRF